MTLTVDHHGATVARTGRDERRDKRAAYITAGDALLLEAETDRDVAARILRVSAANLTVSARNAAMLAAAGCPPMPTRYFGAWRNLGYHVRKGGKGYPTLVRGQSGYRIGYRFAGCDVVVCKGDAPAFRHPGNRPVSRETLEDCRAQTESELAAHLLSAVGGYVPEPPCFTGADLDAARLEVAALDLGCPQCGWDGEGSGGCPACR